MLTLSTFMPGEPSDTRDLADMKELAQHSRITPRGLKLAGGHMFGENTKVLPPAVVNHFGWAHSTN
jgi:hypothetical protein